MRGKWRLEDTDVITNSRSEMKRVAAKMLLMLIDSILFHVTAAPHDDLRNHRNGGEIDILFEVLNAACTG